MEIYTDPLTGCQYVVDPMTGESRWLEEFNASPPLDPSPDGSATAGPRTVRSSPRTVRSSRRRKGIITASGLVGAAAALAVAGSFLPGRDNSAMNADLGTATSPSSPKPNVSRAASATVSASPRAAAAPSARATSGGGGKSSSRSARVAAPVRDGTLEFTVSGSRVTSAIGNEFVSQRAQGQYVLVSLTVKNVGNESQLFMASVQKLFDTAGQQYEADSGASVYLGEEGENYVEEIAPGKSLKTVAVFDIPVGVAIDRVELHESSSTRGADVSLAR
jgi:hypothetical protein